MNTHPKFAPPLIVSVRTSHKKLINASSNCFARLISPIEFQCLLFVSHLTLSPYFLSNLRNRLLSSDVFIDFYHFRVQKEVDEAFIHDPQAGPPPEDQVEGAAPPMERVKEGSKGSIDFANFQRVSVSGEDNTGVRVQLYKSSSCMRTKRG